MVKTKFKETEIGLIPKDWEVVKIGDSFKFKNGLNKEKHFFGYGSPIVNYMDVYKNTFITNLLVKGKVFENYNEQKSFDVLKGDVLFTRTSETPEEIGISSVVLDNLENAVFSGFVLRGRPFNSSFDIQFCRYCFSGTKVREQIIGNCTYTTRALTNGRVLSNIQIPLPPIPEQQAIAKALSDTDAWIESLEKLIDKKRLIKQGAMQELLTPKEDWEEVILGKVAQINMGQSPLSQYYNKRGMGLPLIQGNSDIQNRRTIIRNFTSSITKKGDLGDIIMSVRAPVGEIAIATFNCCLGRGVCSMKYPNRFLYHYLIFREQSWGQVTTGSTFDSVNSTQIENFKIHLPSSLSEQNRIATILSDMDAEIEALQNKLHKAKQLKHGMMQELLTGRIRLVESLEAPKREVEPAKGHNDQFNDAVLIGTMASVFGSDKFPLTRFKYTKVSYLLKRYKEEQDAGYLKHAAGPYKPKTRYGGAEKIAINKKYIDVVATNYKGKEYEGFVASKNVDEAIKYFEDWYGADALKWIEQFKFEKNDNLELWATVDMAIEDLKKKDEAITIGSIKQVLKDNKEWKDKLKRSIFSDINIKTAITKLETLFT